MAAISRQPELRPESWILRVSEEIEAANVILGSDRGDRGVDDGTLKRRRLGRGSKEEKAGENRDPLVLLGFDLMMKILVYLDARSVALSLLVSRSWHGVASSDRLWAPMVIDMFHNEWILTCWNEAQSLISSARPRWSCDMQVNVFQRQFENLQCEELWVGKAHIPRWSKAPGLPKLVSYSRAVMDSKRGRIMREDLCDHAWEFHFAKGAPDYWRNLDPYWKGTGPLMRRYFHPDGSHTADPEDKVWGGHECCYSVVTSIKSDGNMREHYVRINRWPHLCISRRQDWGWELSNFICAYSSIPDAYKEGGTGPVYEAV